MYNIISPEQWMPSDKIILEESAEVSIKTESNILVVAGPGAGKTELLAQKASYLLQTNLCNSPQKILTISFKKDAAANLKERVEKRCGHEFDSRFASLTYDAFAKKILDHFRTALPKELTPNANYEINNDETIESAFEAAGFTNPNRLTQSKLKIFYDNIIAETQIPFDSLTLGVNVWKLLLNGFDNHPACLTFKMVNMLAEHIIKANPYIRTALRATYSHIFLDEFQDTTNLQYNFVKTCFLGSKCNITAVGDSKQRIMLWAGARQSIFSDFQTDFKASVAQLVMNHRSAPRLVELQKQMYQSLNEDKIEVSASDKWNFDDGEVKLYIFPDENCEAQHISTDIQARIGEGFEFKDICILCKQIPSNYTTHIINALSSKGIKARIETDYQDLIKEPIVMLLTSFISLAINRKRPKDREVINNIAETLWEFANKEIYDEYQVNLVKQLNATKGAAVFSDECDDLHKLILDIIDFFGKSKLMKAFPTYLQGTYFDDCITKFVDFLWEEIVQADNDIILAMENFLGLHSIPIMTIHKSKGLEYSSVYFIGLEDGAFWDFKNQPHEDRCAFFVALSRAKQNMCFTFCKSRTSLKYATQNHNIINEFFELLKKPEVAEVIDLSNCNF